MQVCTTPRRALREPLRGLQFSPFRASGNCRDGPARGSLGKGAWGPLGVCPQPSVRSCPGHLLFSVASLWLSLHLSVLSPVFISPHLSFCLLHHLSSLPISDFLAVSVYLPDSPSLSFSSLSFPRLPAFLCLGGLLSLCISLSLSLAVSSLSPPLGVDLCCGIMPSPEGRSGRPAETSADCH